MCDQVSWDEVHLSRLFCSNRVTSYSYMLYCSVHEENEKLTFDLDFGNFSEFYMNNLYFVHFFDRNSKFTIKIQL